MAKENNKGGFRIPNEVERYLKLSFKKFKKENKGFYDTRKEYRNGYMLEQVEMLPAVIKLLTKFGYQEQVRKIKNDLYLKLTDPEFVEWLIKNIKKDRIDFQYMNLLPNIVRNIFQDVKRIQKDMAEKGEEVPERELSDLIELSDIILKKKLKKFEKAGIDRAIAFDVLSIIPSTEIFFDRSQAYYFRELFYCLYEHAKTKEVPYDKIIERLFKSNDAYIMTIGVFAMLERKEKFATLNEKQQKFYIDVTEYTFTDIENRSKNEIRDILKAYLDSRIKDKKQGKDTMRRQYISSLPEENFPKILKEVERIVKSNESMREFF